MELKRKEEFKAWLTMTTLLSLLFLFFIFEEVMFSKKIYSDENYNSYSFVKEIKVLSSSKISNKQTAILVKNIKGEDIIFVTPDKGFTGKFYRGESTYENRIYVTYWPFTWFKYLFIRVVLSVFAIFFALIVSALFCHFFYKNKSLISQKSKQA